MNNNNSIIGHVSTCLGWMLYSIDPATIPGVLASVASVMAIINYFYSIKKNRK